MSAEFKPSEYTDTTLTTNSNIIAEVDSAAAERTVTLPSAAGAFKAFIIVRTGANLVHIAASGSDTIEGAASFDLVTDKGKVIMFTNADGNGWWKMLIP